MAFNEKLLTYGVEQEGGERNLAGLAFWNLVGKGICVLGSPSHLKSNPSDKTSAKPIFIDAVRD